MTNRLTYGLRDRETGYYVRVFSRDDSANIDYPPTMEVGEYANGARLELKRLMDLVETVQESTPREIASERRPNWGDVDVTNCIPVVFIRDETYDVGGGEPVAVLEKVRKLALPSLFAGKVRSTREREKTPDFILKRTFGERLRDVWQDRDSKLLLAEVSSDRIEEGMLIKGGWMGAMHTAVAIVPVPEDWPEASLDGNYQLVLASTKQIEYEPVILEFDADDFTAQSNGPRF